MSFSSMPRFALLLIAFGWSATTSVIGLQSAPPDQVSLNVTVSDDSSNYVTDLNADDFSILENGVKQVLKSVSRPIDAPIMLALLLDTSASSARTLSTSQAVAIDFARRLRAPDVAEVVDFDSRVTVVQPFTNSATELEQAIRKASANGSTSLYNALFITLRELKKMVAKNPDEIRRQVIIVLSDGGDTSSIVSFKEVLDLAQRSETYVYAVVLNDGSRIRGERELRELVEKTGGRLFSPSTAVELAKVSDQLLDDLRGQYAIRYVSNNSSRDGRWRRVEVRVNRPKTKVRTRPGYFAPNSTVNRTQ